MRHLLIATCLLLLALSSRSARAQDFLPATEYVGWSVSAEPAETAPGGSFDVSITAELAAGWKMYAMDSPPPSVGVSFEWDALPAGVESAGPMLQTSPTDAFDPWFETDVRYFTESARFTAPMRVREDAERGERSVAVTARFMICNESVCLPPTTVALQTDVTVAETTTGSTPDLTAGADRPPVAAAPAASSDLDAARGGGLWGFLLLAVAAGLAALLTPCVFPMIPLTVSYFTNHAHDRSHSVRMALVYGASIIITFTALGVLTALFVGAAGAQTVAANPWINLFIGSVFVVFALSLLGLFELRLPNGLLNYFNRQSSGHSGYLGVLFMGLTLTLVSFSCTAPFVGGLLAATASDEWAYPVAGMAVFSATFSLPFIVFALFPKALRSLPRSGSWMNTVKVILGFVELAAALKFLSNADLIWGWGVISRPLAIAVVVVLFGLAGFYLLGKVRLRHEPAVESVGVLRLLASVAFLGLSLYLLPGLFGAPLNALDAYLPPRQASDVSLTPSLSGPSAATEADFGWIDDVDAAYLEARSVQKPVFIDFTGYTCTNCRQMEANVFPREQVASRLRKDFVLLRLYTDDRDRGPDLQRFQLRLTGTVALPTYAIVDPTSEVLLDRMTGMASASELAAFLEHGAAVFQNDVLASAN
jgi:thiol:disulfide interchange protein DsbD